MCSVLGYSSLLQVTRLQGSFWDFHETYSRPAELTLLNLSVSNGGWGRLMMSLWATCFIKAARVSYNMSARVSVDQPPRYI